MCILLIGRNSFLHIASLLTTMSGAWGWALPPAEQQLCLAGLAYFALLPTHRIPRCSQPNLETTQSLFLHCVNASVKSKVRGGVLHLPIPRASFILSQDKA